MVRHDAAKAREDEKSRRIRLSLGIKLPQEIQAEKDAKEKRRLEAQKKAQAGAPLGLEEGQ
jgi:hypothetical protein